MSEKPLDFPKDIIERDAVVGWDVSENYYQIYVRPYGNARWFSDLADYPNGNITTERDYEGWTSVIKVNICR